MLTACDSPLAILWHLLDCLEDAPDLLPGLIKKHATALMHAKERVESLARMRPGMVELSDEALHLIALAESALA